MWGETDVPVHCPARQDNEPALEEEWGDPGTRLLSISQFSLRNSSQPFSWLCPDVQALSRSTATGFFFAGLVGTFPGWTVVASGREVPGLPKHRLRLLLGSSEDFLRNPKTHIRAVRPNAEFNRKYLDCFNKVLCHLHFTKEGKINSKQRCR